MGNSTKDPSVSEIMNEIRGRIGLIESHLPNRVDGIAISSVSKLPFKVLLHREALIWRMAELSRVAFENFVMDKLASAIVLTRAAVETSAALWFLWAKVDASVTSATVGDIDEFLMKLIAGIATGMPTDDRSPQPVTPRPVKVGKFIEQVEKDIEGFSHQYGILSEYAHPNWAGTVYLYAKHNQQEYGVTDFGHNIRKPEGTRLIGTGNLSGALMIFEKTYNLITDLIPPFTMLCEVTKPGDDTPDEAR